MIIRSYIRKDRSHASFSQLVRYMSSEKSDAEYDIYHNCLSRGQKDIADEFHENSVHLKARKGGNYFYHEVLSINLKTGVDRKAAKASLRDMADVFVQNRCPNNLVYGCIHEDHEHHLHYHFMISANELGESKRHYLSKAEYKTLKLTCEDYAHRHHPHLKQDLLQYRKGQTEQKEQKDTKKQSRKSGFDEKAEADIRSAMSQTNSMENFFFFMQERGYEFLVRGKTHSVHMLHADGSKDRFRLKGELLEDFKSFSERNLERQKEAQRDQAEDVKSKSSESSKSDDFDSEIETFKVEPIVQGLSSSDFLNELNERDERRAREREDRAQKSGKRRGKPRR